MWHICAINLSDLENSEEKKVIERRQRRRGYTVIRRQPHIRTHKNLANHLCALWHFFILHSTHRTYIFFFSFISFVALIDIIADVVVLLFGFFFVGIFVVFSNFYCSIFHSIICLSLCVRNVLLLVSFRLCTNTQKTNKRKKEKKTK